MTDALTKLMNERDWLMADGATGTTLFNMGLTSGDAPELWNVDEPAKITALYKGAVDAGSDIFLTNTFGGNASRLKLHDAQSRVRELNRVGAGADFGIGISAAGDAAAANHIEFATKLLRDYLEYVGGFLKQGRS